ncbi:nucleotide sugar dehydrogenase [Paraclostridium bifermentans]|uniref:nucleotide sugar dehydrogenase n=2 Tax=Paraclostridium bifermentans TaxID=1490 RepID=UPI00359C3F1E
MISKICILGIGYIGLPTAALFAKSGHEVIGVDIKQEVVDELNKGNIIIEEPNLKELIKDMVIKKQLRGSMSPCEADVFIVAVPTPIDKSKKSDLSYVMNALHSIIPYLRKGNLLVLESTSPIGTTSEIIKPMLENAGFIVGEDIYLGYCPERVIPGDILNELESNDRLVGGINKISAKKIKDLYSHLVKGNIYITDTKTAEICKLMENTYRDVNIALANELAIICNEVGVNVWDVIKFCNKHPRVNIHYPGPGVGGHCLAVDPWFVVEKVPDKANLIKTSRNINDCMPSYIFKRIEDILKNKQNNKIVTILGMTYKANIDDIRESPIVKLIDILKCNLYNVRVYDPNVRNCEYLYKELVNACENSDLIIIGVDHDIFKYINFSILKKVMNNNAILDTRNFINKEDIKRYGFEYYSI